MVLTFLGLGGLATTTYLVHTAGDHIAVNFWSLFVIFASVLSVSLMLLCASGENEKKTLFAVFSAACVIVSLYFLRFYFYGTDLVEEYSVARVTSEFGRWMPERTIGGGEWLTWHLYVKPDVLLSRYFSTVSVTILPTALSDVSGLPMRTVFWVLIVAVSSVTVLVAFLIVKLCFGWRIGALSSTVFIFVSFYLGKNATILREDIAILFLLLATYCIFKGGTKNLVICLIALALLPMTHYGLFYFAMVFLFLLFISKRAYESKTLRRILRRPSSSSKENSEYSSATKELLIYSIVVGFLWLLFIAVPIFVANISGQVNSIEALLGFTEPVVSPFQRTIISSSLGPFHTVVQWMERVIAVTGLVLALKYAQDRRSFSFTLAGGGMLAVVLSFAYLPTLSSLFDLDRTMHVALVGFSFFIALVLFIISKKNIGKLVSTIIITLFLWETLQMPILYSSSSSLSRQEYIFSTNRVITSYEQSDFRFAAWTESYTPETAVFASDSRGHGLCLICTRISIQPRGANVSDTISLLEKGVQDYVLIVSYVPGYLSFTSDEGVNLEFSSTDVSNLMGSNHLNRIFDNSRIVNFAEIGR